VVAPGTEGLAAVAARFPGVVRDDALDREALAARVFADPAERAALEALLHPRIRALASARFAELAARGEELVVYDAALLVETGQDELVDALVVVAAPPELQVARLVARDGLSPEDASRRVAAQAPLAVKLARASHVIDNRGDLDALRRAVDAVWSAIERGARGPRNAEPDERGRGGGR
jgi:dephospho-CoA kinase